MAKNKTTKKHRDNSGWVNIVPYQFKPGQSGNPGGRPPKRKLLTEYLNKKLDEIDPNDPFGRSNGETLAERMIELARRGNPAAIREIFNRVDGPIVQEIKSSVEPPVIVKIEPHPSLKKDRTPYTEN